MKRKLESASLACRIVPIPPFSTLVNRLSEACSVSECECVWRGCGLSNTCRTCACLLRRWLDIEMMQVGRRETREAVVKGESQSGG